MLNRTADAKMAFEPAFLQIAEGDSVKFLAKDRGHNAETIAGMTPEETAGFKGKINEEIEVMFDTAGLYGIKCKPHFAMGMVMTIAVGEVLEVPETFLEGRISKKPKARFEEQIANLKIGQ
ncbi:MAG TPA: pseudoazurin [Rhodobacteraceae bacterium]|nr:pseudoazurin [Paracoccaceae bacterium]